MNKELVSIVIPCYNQGKYLAETVQSVIASSYRPVEIIIVDDGSEDNTPEVALELQKKHSEVKFISQTNGGVAKARNAGIKAASGKFLLPLDGDDLISKEYISEGVAVLDSRPHVKVVYCRAVKFNESGEKLWRLKPFSINQLARDNMIFVSSLFRKADAESVGGFSEDMLMGREDWEFWIKMLKEGGDVFQLPITGFYYRQTGTSKRKRTGTKLNKRERIRYLNTRHPEFFERELNGPLRFQRRWSKPYNTLLKWLGLL